MPADTDRASGMRWLTMRSPLGSTLRSKGAGDDRCRRLARPDAT
jgi:hypothetical protein